MTVWVCRGNSYFCLCSFWFIKKHWYCFFQDFGMTWVFAVWLAFLYIVCCLLADIYADMIYLQWQNISWFIGLTGGRQLPLVQTEHFLLLPPHIKPVGGFYCEQLLKLCIMLAPKLAVLVFNKNRSNQTDMDTFCAIWLEDQTEILQGGMAQTVSWKELQATGCNCGLWPAHTIKMASFTLCGVAEKLYPMQHEKTQFVWSHQSHLKSSIFQLSHFEFLSDAEIKEAEREKVKSATELLIMKESKKGK